MFLVDSSLILLALIAFATSSIAGIFGFGGGMLLIAALPHFVPASALIPLHSTTQLASNFSRAWLGRPFIQWRYVWPYLLGSIIGIAVAYSVFAQLDLRLLPGIIGVYILLSTWSNLVARCLQKLSSFYLLGAVQTGVSLLVGAPGPMALPVLIKKLSNHHQIVCTIAVFMSVGHILKLAVFMHLQFAFMAYLPTIFVLALAALGGSVAGTRLRSRLKTDNYVWVVKCLLTVLSVLAIYRSYLGLAG